MGQPKAGRFASVVAHDLQRGPRRGGLRTPWRAQRVMPCRPQSAWQRHFRPRVSHLSNSPSPRSSLQPSHRHGAQVGLIASASRVRLRTSSKAISNPALEHEHLGESRRGHARSLWARGWPEGFGRRRVRATVVPRKARALAGRSTERHRDVGPLGARRMEPAYRLSQGT
jgi:hypothetical protein